MAKEKKCLGNRLVMMKPPIPSDPASGFLLHRTVGHAPMDFVFSLFCSSFIECFVLFFTCVLVLFDLLFLVAAAEVCPDVLHQQSMFKRVRWGVGSLLQAAIQVFCRFFASVFPYTCLWDTNLTICGSGEEVFVLLQEE